MGKTNHRRTIPFNDQPCIRVCSKIPQKSVSIQYTSQVMIRFNLIDMLSSINVMLLNTLKPDKSPASERHLYLNMCIPLPGNTPLYAVQPGYGSVFTSATAYSGINSYLSVHTGNDQDLKNLVLNMMLETMNKYREYDAILYADFSIFFAKLLRYYESTIKISGMDNDDMFAHRITTYITEHMTDVRLTDIAAKYHYTPEYTSRLIKTTTGKTFSEILIECRMKQAVTLLKSTVLSVSEISYRIGYENCENLIKTFKRTYGKTPSAYRKDQTESFSV